MLKTSKTNMACFFAGIGLSLIVFSVYSINTQSNPYPNISSGTNDIANNTDSISTNLGVDHQHPTYRILSDWESLLKIELSFDEARWIEDVSINHIVSSINQNADKKQAIINYILNAEDSPTRWFFIWVLSSPDTVGRAELTAQLMRSDRLIDFDAGLSIIMNIEDLPYKSALLTTLLESKLKHEELRQIFAFIRIDEKLISSTLLNQSLTSFYNRTTSNELKALSLKVTRPKNTLEDEMFKRAIALLNSADDKVCFEALNVFNEWLLTYYDLLTNKQNETLKTVVEQISIRLNYSVDTRLKALELYKNLPDR